MRLLFFISSLRGGGAERVLTTLCNELVNRGHEVIISTNIQIPFSYQLDERIKILDLTPPNSNKFNKLLYWIRFYRHIRRIVKHLNPQIITSFISGLNCHIILSTIGMKVPVIASEHTTFDKPHTTLRYIKRFYINKLATHTIVLTKHDYNFIGSRLNNKVVINNPLSFPISQHVSKRQKTVLAAGNIDRWKGKGFDNLIKVWGNISSCFPEWKLKIAGSGTADSFNLLNTLVRENGVEDSVIFLGFQTDMIKVFRKHSIFVLSSRHEGFGMVLLEAMSQGCACVSFDCIAGPNEIMTHNKSGMLVDNQNLMEMETTLRSLMSNEDLRNKLSQGALEEAKRFSSKVIVDKWESLYKKLLNV